MPRHYSRRGFVSAGLATATLFRLQRSAHALGLDEKAKVCQLAAEQEEGPYYVADELVRPDITEGKPGVPLSLRIVVLDARTCTPLPQAAIDLWHCDALGLYSGFTKQNPMGPGPGGPGPGGPPPPGPPPGFDRERRGGRPPGPPPAHHPTDALTFCRGIQLTGADGVAEFHTIFPGVYMGRTNHIHFKVRVGGKVSGRSYQAGHAAYTGQIFFPEELAAKLMEREPYRQHEIHRTTQAEDHVYGDQHGELSIARIEPVGAKEGPLAFHAELIAAVSS